MLPSGKALADLVKNPATQCSEAMQRQQRHRAICWRRDFGTPDTKRTSDYTARGRRKLPSCGSRPSQRPATTALPLVSCCFLRARRKCSKRAVATVWHEAAGGGREPLRYRFSHPRRGLFWRRECQPAGLGPQTSLIGRLCLILRNAYSPAPRRARFLAPSG